MVFFFLLLLTVPQYGKSCPDKKANGQKQTEKCIHYYNAWHCCNIPRKMSEKFKFFVRFFLLLSVMWKQASIGEFWFCTNSLCNLMTYISIPFIYCANVVDQISFKFTTKSYLNFQFNLTQHLKFKNNLKLNSR